MATDGDTGIRERLFFFYDYFLGFQNGRDSSFLFFSLVSFLSPRLLMPAAAGKWKARLEAKGLGGGRDLELENALVTLSHRLCSRRGRDVCTRVVTTSNPPTTLWQSG
jgi:hypothetical protein